MNKTPATNPPCTVSLSPLMLVGTGSDVGKSIIATAFCRIFLQDGYHPAPFKAQNMALNSYATSDGLEIGRAQAVQAEAAGVPCETDMNPLLLKPNSDHSSQVILNGKPIGNQSARDYFRKQGREELRQAVHAAFDRLSQRFNPIVMEGAGSIAEINLRDVDIVNMSMAQHAQASVILVADIERGGVFASVYGTLSLLIPEERQLVKGIIINKFRGDMSLFDEGRKMLEQLCGIPVLGVLPYFTDIHIEEEDSLSLEKKQSQAATHSGKVEIVVVLLRHISNFTDFDSLERDPRVHLYYSNNTEEIQKADIVIIPGSKSTIPDLMELRNNGCSQAILQAHHDGKTVIGICGGYQMMGEEIIDPHHVESTIERMPGLGLLPIITTLSQEKRTVQVEFEYKDELCKGYEIHTGTSVGREDRKAHRTYHRSPKCWGTYIHGILDNPAVIEDILSPFAPSQPTLSEPFDYPSYKQTQYNHLATLVRQNVDMDKVYEILKIKNEK